jgi:outer membrane protein
MKRSSPCCHARLALAALLIAAACRADDTPGVSLGEAVERTLASQPGVGISNLEVTQSQGLAQTAAGEFDWGLGSSYSSQVQRTPTGAPPSPLIVDERTDTDTFTLELNKLFRNGISITPEATVVDFKDNLQQQIPASTANFGVQVSVPLLRGLGVQNADAQELAAKASLHAQEELARYQIESLVFQTASAYWSCLAAKRNLDVLEDTEKLAEQLYQSVEVLGEAGEADRGTVDQAHAQLAAQQANTEQGRLTLYQDRQALATAMGYGPKELARAPIPSSDFPVVMAETEVAKSLDEKCIYEALVRRGDYLAAGINVDVQRILLVQAKDNLKPSLNAQVQLGYAGYDAQQAALRPFYSLDHNLSGVNALAELSLAWPIENNVARGAYVSQKSVFEQAKLNEAQTANTIASATLTDLETLRRTIRQYGLATQAVDIYSRAVKQAIERLKIGEATLTDLIDIENDYSQARQLQIATLGEYATALAELRLLTGTLTTEENHHAVFRARTLVELPFEQK